MVLDEHQIDAIEQLEAERDLLRRIRVEERGGLP